MKIRVDKWNIKTTKKGRSRVLRRKYERKREEITGE
jgi:hypothetical protein